MPNLMRIGGCSRTTKGAPKFTYTGQYVLDEQSDENWQLLFITSGEFSCSEKLEIDLFLCGGGGAGSGGAGRNNNAGTHLSNSQSCGGGGGYTKTYRNIALSPASYSIVIGNGATGDNVWGSSGGASSAFGYSAAGGYGGGSASGIGGATPDNMGHGGDGGSGGGCTGSSGPYGYSSTYGASDGGTATDAIYDRNTIRCTGGIGQGTTTRSFGESTGFLCSGGGGGGGASNGGSYGGTSGCVGGEGGGGYGSHGAYTTNPPAPNGVNGGHAVLSTVLSNLMFGGGGGGGSAFASGNVHGNGGNGAQGIVVIRNKR